MAESLDEPSTRELNNVINRTLRQEMKDIQKQDEEIGYAMHKTILNPLAKLSSLAAVYEEEMLHNHGLPGKLRCQSRVQTYHV